MHSYGYHWTAGRNKTPDARFKDALEYLEYCHSLGAGGVQVGIGAQEPDYAATLRRKAAEYGMYIEAQASLPRQEPDVERFDAEVRTAKESGADVIRTAMLSGRRYETFDSPQAFDEFAKRSWTSLTLAEPVVRKHGLRLAVENHKDWRIPELLDILKRISSEHVGVCVDMGNSIALLENPLMIIEAYAPFAFSTHLKDMAVEEYEDGFLLSEVPLGEGFLDLKPMIEILNRTSPRVRFLLEMITRDPLKIPCLTAKYWATMQWVPGRELAGTLAMVRKHASKKPLPRVAELDGAGKLRAEDDNVRKSLAFAQQQLGL
jgi:3-oxoisoapionate decarboxylase